MCCWLRVEAVGDRLGCAPLCLVVVYIWAAFFGFNAAGLIELCGSSADKRGVQRVSTCDRVADPCNGFTV